MRCKNCGAENDESRFICENCGSPLYDENEEIINGDNEFYEDEYGNQNPNDDEAEKKKKKRNIIIICIVAAVVVIAVIVGVVFAIVGNNDKEPETTNISTSEITTEESTTKKKHTTTEKQTTEKVETTKETTTKQTTTQPTTTAPSFNISIDIDGNGSVTGDGQYTSGKKAALIATADEGYQFMGWYDNSTGSLVASSNKYTVTVKKDINLTAKFEKLGEVQ